jgi:ATP-dependent exoDNAse (exonuclease V) beta subunit
MTTLARPTTRNDAHWYGKDGTPAYDQPNKSKGGTRPTTLSDAKKQGLLPSVTTVLQILAKPALNTWLQEQAILAVMTTPRLPGEADDAFVQRVLHTDRTQDEEARVARERGTEIHSELENMLNGDGVPDEILPWIAGAFEALNAIPRIPAMADAPCNVLATELILVGEGYAGKTDLILDRGDHDLLVDFKSAKRLPEKGSWSEHRLQLSAYAAAHQKKQVLEKPIRTANLYISTVECGRFVLCENPDWQIDFDRGFAPLLKVWRWQNGF